MKMRYKRQVSMYSIGGIKNLEQHFADMAAKGWMIDKLGLFSQRYSACEPCEKHFFVDLLPQITSFDYPENEDAQSYRQICEDSGWTFITANKQTHVFCVDIDAPPPVPIHTDERVQAKIYMKACLKYELMPYLLCLLLFVYQLYNQLRGIGYDIILSNLSILLLLAYMIFLPEFIWILASTLLWYTRTARAARNGLPMPVANRRVARVRSKLFLTSGALFILFILFGVLLEIFKGAPPWILLVLATPLAALSIGLFIRRRIDTRERKRGDNIKMFAYIIIAMVVVLIAIQAAMFPLFIRVESDSVGDRPVLTLSDVGVITPPERSFTDVRGSILVPVHYQYWEINRQGNADISVYRPMTRALAQGLYEHCVQVATRGYSYLVTNNQVDRLTSEDAELWGADEGAVITYPGGGSFVLYLLRGRTLLYLDISGDGLTPESAAEAVRGLWARLDAY